jgi:hypothetical protein
MDAERDETVSAREPDANKSEPREGETAIAARRESEPVLAWSVDGPDYTQQLAPNGMSPEQTRTRATWIAYAAVRPLQSTQAAEGCLDPAWLQRVVFADQVQSTQITVGDRIDQCGVKFVAGMNVIG